ncbi:hypothetical protein INT46_005220 [Mucor plumbeus]|uniref:Uncharacterized protein n=1 Tax=Mucor plumbeus TaxID=97098 RepID=A0A8H7QTB5_9FUNG|nr:hypothetical protein INT46_005220 [Mucor plumbeus]
MKGDHSFKIIKKLGKVKDSSVFAAIYALTHLEETFIKFFVDVFASRQRKTTIYISTDDVLGDQKFLKDCLPPLKTNFEHKIIPKITENPDSPVLNFPEETFYSKKLASAKITKL